VRIVSTHQLDVPPKDKPLVEEPVKAHMDIPLYYMTERGPTPWNHSIFCAKVFAETILLTLNRLLSDSGLGMVHLGVYNPRMARKRDGTPITPKRWSNHSYGLAVDFKGVVDEYGKFEDIRGMDKFLLSKIEAECRGAVGKWGRKWEIVDEGDWLHLGIWKEG